MSQNKLQEKETILKKILKHLLPRYRNDISVTQQQEENVWILTELFKEFELINFTELELQNNTIKINRFVDTSLSRVSLFKAEIQHNHWPPYTIIINKIKQGHYTSFREVCIVLFNSLYSNNLISKKTFEKYVSKM